MAPDVMQDEEQALSAPPLQQDAAVWARLKSDIHGVRKYQLGLLFESEFWYTCDKTTLLSPLAPSTPPELILQDCVVRKATESRETLRVAAEYPVVPDAAEIRHWESVDENTDCDIVCNTPTTILAPGNRVTVFAHVMHEKPGLRRSGFITDAQRNGLCRVRVCAGGKPIRALSDALISDLLSIPTHGDEIVVDGDEVRPHFLVGDVTPVVGDRVVVLAGPHRRRVGTVDHRQQLSGTTVVGIRSGEIILNNVAVSHIARLLLPGDKVKIVYGHFAGEEGYISRTFSLNNKHPTEPQVPAGGIQVHLNKNNTPVETIAQWVRFLRTDGTSPGNGSTYELEQADEVVPQNSTKLTKGWTGSSSQKNECW
ncbi:hypothetical protein HMN09_00937500 [Mycena chlorophos]|uniref:KOW domain-containing protein n=1 Tax=Mycena chlorophos TaxID=658473 RepID=A0A8H6SIX2_MYCCL|nr:hypothetical protein HMN09_00937500 [Mycena chlorophos]